MKKESHDEQWRRESREALEEQEREKYHELFWFEIEEGLAPPLPPNESFQKPKEG